MIVSLLDPPTRRIPSSPRRRGSDRFHRKIPTCAGMTVGRQASLAIANSVQGAGGTRS